MVSQTVEYALRAMSHLASLHQAVTSVEIARATKVPHGYLSKVMRDLVCADLVRSFRGRRGGFILAREPAAISVLDIVNAVDPIHRIDHCPLENPLHATLCPLHRCLDDAMAHIEKVFARATLDGVVQAAAQDGCCRSLFVSDTPAHTERSKGG
ncbi:MAG: Rrf2 family transcriptional regulator [Phycisphaerales bacterium]